VRALLQRAAEARVIVDGEVVGEIGHGLLILLGVGLDDDELVARDLAEKVVELRIFDDEQGRMNRSVIDVGGEALVVSQFTLWGECRSGRRPSWSRAAPAAQAEPLYRAFMDAMRARGVRVAEGRFGASMDVHVVNRGPVTLLLE
jgi:D-tyrosyl-tRNA(Tyr) deacylase